MGGSGKGHMGGWWGGVGGIPKWWGGKTVLEIIGWRFP